MKVSSVTILYNFDQDVIDNIKTYDRYVDEVILVDNSDNEKYAKKFEKVLSNYTYISMNGNKGIAKALNVGLEYSKKAGYEWVLTMDQDTYLDDDIIEKYKNIVTELNDEKIIILSPIYKFDRKKKVEFQGVRNVKYVMQSANLVNINNFYKVGIYKEDFFIDVVDYEYCLRANKKGYRVLSCGQVEVNHNPGITRVTKIFNVKYGYCSKYRIYYQARNLLWTFKNYKNFNILLILIYKLVKILAFFDNKKEFLKFYFNGIRDCQIDKFGGLENE